MGRSGGGGGGGRSGGFSGGGRSSGGFSGGFGSGRSGRSRPSRGPSFRFPRTTVFIHRPRYYGAPPPGGPPPAGGHPGCGLSVLAFVLVAAFVVGIFSLLSSSGGGEVAKSTVEREPLPSSAVTETEYYTDEPGWISNQNELLSGMKSFYQQTGVHSGAAAVCAGVVRPSLYRRGAFPAGFLGQRYGKLSLRIHSGGPG